MKMFIMDVHFEDVDKNYPSSRIHGENVSVDTKRADTGTW